MSVISIIETWVFNIAYLIVYIFTYGSKTFHEGTYFPFLQKWVTWSANYSGKPRRFVYPTSNEQVAEAIKTSKRVRATGGGHTFNTSAISDDTMISLDKYNKITSIDLNSQIVKVQAGIRLRDFMSQIEKEGLSLPTLGSTNAQSLGGLVGTDLHGSAKDQGYLSDRILSLTLVDGNGEIKTLRKDRDPEFFAVTGGVGSLGVVTELEILCRKGYRLEKLISVVERKTIEQNIDTFYEYHDHLSFYYIGGAKVQTCRMNTWNETVKDESFLYHFRHFVQEIIDFIACGFLLGISRFLGTTNVTAEIGLQIMKILMNQSLVTIAGKSFSRQLFYRHDEIEYGVPFEKYNECLQELVKKLENEKFVTIVEIRFCPPSQSLIGPGAGRKTVFFELAPSLSKDPTPMFKAAEIIFEKYGGQPHLGKWTTTNPDKMKKVHGHRYDEFLKFRERYDPHGKFTNAFTNQVFPARS